MCMADNCKNNTEYPKTYRNSVLHLLKYTANLYLSRCSTDLRQLLGHSVYTQLTMKSTDVTGKKYNYPKQKTRQDNLLFITKNWYNSSVIVSKIK